MQYKVQSEFETGSLASEVETVFMMPQRFPVAFVSEPVTEL